MKYFIHGLFVCMLSLAIPVHGQEVNISIDRPDRVNAGEEFTVTVTIDKGALTDYSRFSQDLPEGLTANNVSSPNADFSFDNQRVRIIWLKMPDAEQLQVSYKVMVDPRLKGSFNMGGVFAYVVDDERKFLNFDSNGAITIIPSATMDPELLVDIRDFQGGGAVAPAASSSSEIFAMAIRQKPVLQADGSYLVHLLMDNPTGSKYAKIEESVPSGYLFEEVSSSDGIVSHASSTVKFIWMKLPGTSEFEVSYKLVPKANETQGEMTITGELTYTSGNENKTSAIKEMDVAMDVLTSAQKRTLLSSGVIPAGVKEKVAETKPPPPPKETKAPVEVKPVSSASVIDHTGVLNPGTGTFFRVQLIAKRKSFNAVSYFKNAGVKKEVLVEKDDGLYKYTAGPFQSYNEAVAYKNQVSKSSEMKGAFVVGYSNGKRVAASSIR